MKANTEKIKEAFTAPFTLSDAAVEISTARPGRPMDNSNSRAAARKALRKLFEAGELLYIPGPRGGMEKATFFFPEHAPDFKELSGKKVRAKSLNVVEETWPLIFLSGWYGPGALQDPETGMHVALVRSRGAGAGYYADELTGTQIEVEFY